MAMLRPPIPDPMMIAALGLPVAMGILTPAVLRPFWPLSLTKSQSKLFYDFLRDHII
jgi:hypothetical protein